MISRNVIINLAHSVGFDLVGVVRAEPLYEEHNRFKEWMLAGNSSTLSYLERNVEKRFDASLLVEGINGDYFNVVGFPVARVKRELLKFLKNTN
jgi:epoxyqueuosine reductase QueG